MTKTAQYSTIRGKKLLCPSKDDRQLSVIHLMPEAWCPSEWVWNVQSSFCKGSWSSRDQRRRWWTLHKRTNSASLPVECLCVLAGVKSSNWEYQIHLFVVPLYIWIKKGKFSTAFNLSRHILSDKSFGQVNSVIRLKCRSQTDISGLIWHICEPKCSSGLFITRLLATVCDVLNLMSAAETQLSRDGWKGGPAHCLRLYIYMHLKMVRKGTGKNSWMETPNHEFTTSLGRSWSTGALFWGICPGSGTFEWFSVWEPKVFVQTGTIQTDSLWFWELTTKRRSSFVFLKHYLT